MVITSDGTTGSPIKYADGNLRNHLAQTNYQDGDKLEVENKTGTELPSTGGMGTTIFYVLGAILLAGATVLLITKKRMSGGKI